MKTKRRQHKRTKRTKRRRGGGPHTKQTTLSMGQTPLPKKSKSMKRTTVKTPKVNKYLLAIQQEDEKKEARQHLHYLDQWINIVNSSGLLKHMQPHLPTYKVDKHSLEFIKHPITGEKIEYTLAEVKELAKQRKHAPDLHPTRDFPYMGQDWNTPRPKSKSHY
jgi:hypothetical protein